MHVKYCHDLLLLLLLFNAFVGATADVEAASIFILVPVDDDDDVDELVSSSLFSFLLVVVFVHFSEIAWTKFSPRRAS